MNNNRLKFEDIEEVQSAPRRRNRHNHTHNDYRPINTTYDGNHFHSDINSNVNINGGNNEHQHHHHHHHHHHRPQWTEFGCKQIILMCIFGVSMGVLFLSFITNLILTIKQVMTPRFFLPSIILIFISFLCSGGIMGTYLTPPHKRRNPLRVNELLIMRTFVPSIMLVVSLLFLLLGGGNIKNLKEDLNKSEDLCKRNKGLSMEEIYIKTNKITKELISQKEDIRYAFQNNLMCYPFPHCVNINSDSNNYYICNSQDFIKNESIKINCGSINLKENSKQILQEIKNQKNGNLFFNNCLDLNKNFFKSEINLFKCESDFNLENIKFSKNLSIASNMNIKEYLNIKLVKILDEIKKAKEIIFKYEKTKYDYDLDCLHHNDYIFSHLLLNIYLYVFYALCVFWIIFGIYSMHRLINLGIEGKLEFLDDRNDEQRINNYNNVNSSEDDGEVNQLNF